MSAVAVEPVSGIHVMSPAGDRQQGDMWTFTEGGVLAVQRATSGLWQAMGEVVRTEGLESASLVTVHGVAKSGKVMKLTFAFLF